MDCNRPARSGNIAKDISLIDRVSMDLDEVSEVLEGEALNLKTMGKALKEIGKYIRCLGEIRWIVFTRTEI